MVLLFFSPIFQKVFLHQLQQVYAGCRALATRSLRKRKRTQTCRSIPAWFLKCRL